MFRIFLGLFFLVSLVSFSQAQDIRSVKFGMSPTEVKENEHAQLVTEGDQDYYHYIMFEDKIGNYKAYISYVFAKNKLTRVRYSFIEEHSNKNLFLDDFNNIDQILIKKYGPANTFRDYIWSDDLYKDDKSDYGMAIGIGDLTIQSIWETNEMKIYHTLDGDNYSISHDIEYQSKQFKSIEEKAREEENLSDF